MREGGEDDAGDGDITHQRVTMWSRQTSTGLDCSNSEKQTPTYSIACAMMEKVASKREGERGRRGGGREGG